MNQSDAGMSGVGIRIITKKYFAHVSTDCRCSLKIYRHSYFPDAASAEACGSLKVPAMRKILIY